MIDWFFTEERQRDSCEDRIAAGLVRFVVATFDLAMVKKKLRFEFGQKTLDWSDRGMQFCSFGDGGFRNVSPHICDSCGDGFRTKQALGSHKNFCTNRKRCKKELDASEVDNSTPILLDDADESELFDGMSTPILSDENTASMTEETVTHEVHHASGSKSVTTRKRKYKAKKKKRGGAKLTRGAMKRSKYASSFILRVLEVVDNSDSSDFETLIILILQ